jgi:hypothetical protein
MAKGGGYIPLFYMEDVNDEMIDRWKKSNKNRTLKKHKDI